MLQKSSNTQKTEHETLVALMSRMHADICLLPQNIGSQISGLLFAVQRCTEQLDVDVLARRLTDVITPDLIAQISVPLANQLRDLQIHLDNDALPAVQRELENKLTYILNTNHLQVSDHLHQIPALTKCVIADVLASLKSGMDETRREVGCIQTSLASDRLEKVGQSTASKGGAGEFILFDLLSRHLRARDGFAVEHTAGQACSCDILVKRSGFPDIRIESKSHGQNTGEKVRSCNVVKFQRDLEHTRCHGLFVSLYTEIVGIGNYEIQQMPTGRFAIYLCKIGENVEPVVEMIQLLYTLDSLVSSTISSDSDNVDDDDDDVDGCRNDKRSIRVDSEKMIKVQSYLKEYGTNVCSAKQHMRAALKQLGSIDYERVSNILLGDGGSAAKNTSATFECQLGCGKTFSTRGGMLRHAQRCINKTQTSVHN
jgi:hypothetical protein